jgi:hypothetical protein
MLTIKQVKDPNAPEIQEGAGAITSDSLAAESTREGGKFAENRDSEPQGVSGSISTIANTNTSGATRLDPAPDAETRSTSNKSMHPGSLGEESSGLAVQDTSQSNNGAVRGVSDAGIAPTHVASKYVDGGLPKGKNLTEGGFDSNDGKNPSFTSEIGSQNDPGRLAEQKFQMENADAAEDAGMPRQQGITGDNSFDALGGETSA